MPVMLADALPPYAHYGIKSSASVFFRGGAICGCGVMATQRPSKPLMRVQSPPSAPKVHSLNTLCMSTFQKNMEKRR